MLHAPIQTNPSAIAIPRSSVSAVAQVPALVEPFRFDLAALSAPLRGLELWSWGFSHGDTSVCSFVSNIREKLSGSPIQDRLVEAGLCRRAIGRPLTRLLAWLGLGTLRHVFDRELFREDGEELEYYDTDPLLADTE